MRKKLILVTLILGIIFSAGAQSTGPMDLIVLLDTSSNMSNYYQDTNNYLIGAFLREFLRIGDTFHLFSFSGNPRLEISRRVEGIGDVEIIIARMLLLKPLDPDSNMSGAIGFAEQFASSLPGNRASKIVLFSTAPESNIITDAANRLRGRGTDLQYIRVPVTGNPSSGRQQTFIAQQQSQQQGQQQGQQQLFTQPADQTQAGQVFEQGQDTPFVTVTQPSGDQVTGQQGTQETAQTDTTQAGTAVTGTTVPAPVTQDQTQTAAAQGGLDIPLPLLIGLIILGVLILALIIFMLTRNLHSSPNRAMYNASAGTSDSRSNDMLSDYAKSQRNSGTPPIMAPPPERKKMPKDIPDMQSNIFDGGPAMLSIFVEDQNTAIGKRNIHSVKPGSSYSVGGGNSDFLIFLVPVPPNIGELRYDGRSCTFVPLKPKYFPDLGSQYVSNCIGRTIRIVSDKNYEMHFRIVRYEDPLLALNKLLNSIQMPGI